MKTTKIISLLLAGTMLMSTSQLSMVSAEDGLVTSEQAMEGYGNYPAASAHNYSGGNSIDWTPSGVEAYKFDVDGRSFVLLDRDNDGNYLVMANEDYGYKPWLQSGAESLNTTRPVTPAANWYFDPANTNSIAYWLNHDFLTNGNGGKKLPNGVIDYIITDRQWYAEPVLKYNIGVSGTVTDEVAAKENYQAYLSYKDGAYDQTNARAFTAGVVLPSKAEINVYKNKISTSSTVWYDRIYTRTPLIQSQYIVSTDTFNTKFSAFFILAKSSGTVQCGLNDDIKGASNQGYKVRPMFWLDKDFFKNVAIDLSTAGEQTLLQIKQYPRTDLDSIYSRSQLVSLGYELGAEWAGYGNYPSAGQMWMQGTTGVWTSSGADTDYVFSVNGRSFVLLDRDNDGNYLIMANEDYGRKSWLLSGTSSLASRITNTAGTMPSLTDWYFDPQNTNSIAYWLNHDFLTSGNGGKVMPSSIVNNIITDRTWYTEPEFGNDTSGTVAEADTDNYRRYISFKNDFTANHAQRSITAGVVFPATREIQVYASKIYTSETNWDKSFWTRTAAVYPYNYSAATDTFTLKPGAALVRKTNATTQQRWMGDSLDGDTGFCVRPMFWLDKDFFKTEAIDVTGIGSKVLAQITQYSAEDLDAVYTKSQLAALGYDVGEEWVGYGNYPEAMTLSGETRVMSETVPGASPAENVFYVDDGNGNTRSFILLDRDNSGNYFVMAEETYGEQKFSDLIGTTVDDENVMQSPETYDEDWYFDPSNESSIAYWLNHDFLTNGNGGRKIPASMVNKIIERTWQIENDFVRGKENITSAYESGTANITATDYLAYQNWLAAKADKRDVTAKIALPSYTEYLTYMDKIGAESYRPTSDWAGFMTRTTSSSVEYSESKGITYKNYFYHICGSASDCTYVMIKHDGETYSPTYATVYRVRPVFWLSSDFFGTVKLTLPRENGIHTIGSNIIPQVKQYDDATLTALGYTQDEIDIIRGKVLTKITNISITDADGNDLETVNGQSAIYASVTVVPGNEDETRTVVLAVYDSANKLVGFESTVIQVTANANTFEQPITLLLDSPAGANYKCKVLVWGTMSDMKPYTFSELN